jgi:hypothetical protein
MFRGLNQFLPLDIITRFLPRKGGSLFPHDVKLGSMLLEIYARDQR